MQDRTSQEQQKPLCPCFGVTKADVDEAIQLFSADNVEDIMRYTEAGTGCMSCRCAIRNFIAQKQSEAAQLKLA